MLGLEYSNSVMVCNEGSIDGESMLLRYAELKAATLVRVILKQCLLEARRAYQYVNRTM